MNLSTEDRSIAADQTARPMEIDDLFRYRRVAGPQVSPDAKWVAYEVTKVLFEENKSETSIWLADVSRSTAPTQLTNAPSKRDSHPRWSPDGKQILFESNRSGKNQLWVIDLAGGEARQLTQISTGASSGIWSPDGKHIAFVSEVYPEFSELPFQESDLKNAEKAKSIEESKVKARTFTHLFFRHWDSYVEGKRQHLFVCKADGSDCRDVTPGDRDANPTSSTFSFVEDFTFTPDSTHLIFTAVPEKGEAWSTDYTLCRVNLHHPNKRWERLLPETHFPRTAAAQGSPQFSPLGTHLAFLSQSVPGYEADTWRLNVVACNRDGSIDKRPASVSKNIDRSCADFCWADQELIYFTAEEEGSYRIYVATGDEGSAVPTDFPTGQIAHLSVSGSILAYQKARMDHPAEIFIHDVAQTKNRGAARLDTRNVGELLSHANDGLRDELACGRPESVSVPVEGGTMQMWILKPPGFDGTKKWPIAYLVHGGPQGAWEDGWSYRWCPQLWAAQGYVVALPNPRGSTGFGAKFVREISEDWGGKCYRDLMAGVDYLEKQPWCDRDRIGAAGASFGGYMMNWFAVSTNRFKALITHCSVWNLESMWGTTEELWFAEFENGGVPWEKPAKYREFSPHAKAGNLGKHRTPMLVIHNDLDFRCPIGQGHELFSALQRQGVESRFVNFPDEGHWVNKPANSRHWHQECFGWLTKYVPPGPK
jgi:dipeptidyl aminopeptidase/acylaminoacyl peptidase